MYGRNGEAPLPIIAPRSPADCFDAALEAARIAITYRTPVILLSDGYLANGSEPWLLPDVAELAPIDPASPYLNPTQPFRPYDRDESTLARPWAIPGVAGLEHRIGGLEKADGLRRHLLRPRQPRRDGPAAPGQGRPRRRRHRPHRGRRPGRRRPGARPRVGVELRTHRRGVQGRPAAGIPVAQAHLRHLNPFPPDLGAAARALRPGARAGDEPRPAAACCSAPSSSSTRSATTACKGMPLQVDELIDAIVDLHRTVEEHR